ncbi:MAG: HalOD1 output domain-containing protein [Haloferacaceae archaeon]
MDGAITRGIVDAVAEERGVDPSELDFVLYDYIDPSALQRLARHDGGAWTLSFDLPEYEVTVTSDGKVSLDAADRELEA